MSEAIPKSDLTPPEDMDKWEKEHPVIIPPEIEEEMKQRQEELNDPNLTYERWSQIMEDQKKTLEGRTDRDRYVQLYYLRKRKSQGDDGLNSQRHALEQTLRNCWCGSGKKYLVCHGSGMLS